MLAVGGRKVVGAREILLGAHIEVVVMRIIQHGIQAYYRRYAYRTGRQTAMDISVIRGVNIEVGVEDTPDAELL